MTEHDPNLDPRTCYGRGCKKVSCIDANAEYQREWRRSDSAVRLKQEREMQAQRIRAQKLREQAAWAAE